MELSRQELFQKLLEQVQLADANEPALADGRIKAVVVHQQSSSWEFQLTFNKILPVAVYRRLREALENSFDGIVKEVRLTIATPTDELDEKLLVDYWPLVANQVVGDSPVGAEMTAQSIPTVNGHHVILTVSSQQAANFFADKLVQQLGDAYTRVGFPSFKLTVKVNQEASQKRVAEVRKKQAAKDQDLVKKAMAELAKKPAKHQSAAPAGPVVLGKPINPKIPVTRMGDITDEERNVVLEGYVFSKEVTDIKSGRQILVLEVTDYTSSFVIKKFSNSDTDKALFAKLAEGDWVKVRGPIQEDAYMHDLTMMAFDINQVSHRSREDKAPTGKKRVELHLHSKMSQMDATNTITDYVNQAHQWGMPALAITDHTDVQAFPEAARAAKGLDDFKMLYGVEANLVDEGMPIVYNPDDHDLLDADYVIFDVETTGLSAIYDKVIELSATKMHHGEVLDHFDEFIDPGFPLSKQTIDLTSITDDMVRGSKSEKEVFDLFREFCKGSLIAGHNVSFDLGFMNTGYRRHGEKEIDVPVIDTLPLARVLYPHLRSYRLNTLSKKFGVALEHHHRANYDAEATGHLLHLFLKDAEKQWGVTKASQLNSHMGDNDAYRHTRPSHAILMAQTQAGLKNLYKLISLSNVRYFSRVPRIPRRQLDKLRDGILVGTACHRGEVFTAMMQKGYEAAKQKAKYYDYIEVQPKANYAPLIEEGLISDQAKLEEIIKNMVKLGDDLKKPVVATGDVHYLNPEDADYRRVLIASQGGANPLNHTQRPDVHFRTTDEMLADFAFLGEKTAQEIVVDNTQEIADSIEKISPVAPGTYPPHMEGANDEITKRTYDTAKAWYGDPLPKIVADRIKLELDAIIKNGFAVHYLIAQRLVAKSNKDGYLVGSRGSVGSSVVATLSGVTEVNPLPPHYRCPKCQYSQFFTKGEYSSGYDLPDKDCPKCGTLMVKDGQNIPFQTFLGFEGNKVPDIDLNFSGDYQPIAHNYMKVLFGSKNVYRAGTIGTIADKTAYGYVKAYERENDREFRKAEEDRLAKGATGVKRTTGQHPAGIIIVPDDKEIYDFTPVQYPADDQSADWETTHFDFHSIHDNLLKMDILGHDDPTMIRELQDLSGVDPKTIPMDDPGVMSLFSSPEALGVTPEQINSQTGTLGLPEFGTRFVRGMLEETHPQNYSQLLQISGLSHGTDVWNNNAEDLINNHVATIANVIGCRDNIMTDLINYGLKSESAFQVMESVRHGRGIPEKYLPEMKKVKVPQWYMDSCSKIKYMFPRAHAAAYVLMALRIAYFKVYCPLIYYCAFFSVRASDFDVVAMSQGKNAVKGKINELVEKERNHDATAKDKNLETVLDLANEMLERGFNFKMVDLNRSDATKWLIDGNSLIAPFSAIPGLGINAAKQIVAAREEQEFLSKEDLAKRGHVSQTLIDFMTDQHVLDGLPDQNQLSLFDF